jgi:3D (Asp-Asp-Asp) domain-containing protein
MIRFLLVALLFSTTMPLSSQPIVNGAKESDALNYSISYEQYQIQKFRYSLWYAPKIEVQLPRIPMTQVKMPKIRKVWARVTACSPYDSDSDIEYYNRNGYEGATYNIAADMRQFKKGTKIRVEGYMDVSYPNKFWNVDSKGGPVIRDSVDDGVIHIDVKFATRYSAAKWGSKMMWIEVIDP